MAQALRRPRGSGPSTPSVRVRREFKIYLKRGGIAVALGDATRLAYILQRSRLLEPPRSPSRLKRGGRHGAAEAMNRASVVADLNRRLDALGTGPLSADREDRARPSWRRTTSGAFLACCGEVRKRSTISATTSSRITCSTSAATMAGRNATTSCGSGPDHPKKSSATGSRASASPPCPKVELEQWVAQQLEEPPSLMPQR